MNYFKLLKMSRLLLVFAAVLLVSVLVFRDLRLNGDFHVRHDFLKPSPFVTPLVPEQRVRLSATIASIIAEPVYTNLRFPRPFKQALVKVTFRDDSNALFELGPKTGPEESYDLQALNHPQLNQLFVAAGQWTGVAAEPEASILNGESNQLYQLRSASYIYTKLEQFNSSLPAKQATAYYGLDWQAPYLPAEKIATTTISARLKGAHQFYLAAGASTPLSVQVDYYDLNNYAGADEVKLELLDWQGQTLADVTRPDDGYSQELGVTSPLQTVKLSDVTLAASGVIELRLAASTDMLVQEIRVNSAYVVAKGRVRLAGSPDDIAEFGRSYFQTNNIYTSARTWTAQTNSRQSVQAIRLGNETLMVEEPLRAYTYRVSAENYYSLDRGYEIMLEKGDVELQGRGVFAFSQEQYFSPFPWFIDDTVRLEASPIQYIFTDYQPPARLDDGFSVQSLPIDLARVFAPNKDLRLKFAVSQGIDEAGIEIKEITVDYQSDPVTFANAKNKFLRFIEREL